MIFGILQYCINRVDKRKFSEHAPDSRNTRREGRTKQGGIECESVRLLHGKEKYTAVRFANHALHGSACGLHGLVLAKLVVVDLRNVVETQEDQQRRSAARTAAVSKMMEWRWLSQNL